MKKIYFLLISLFFVTAGFSQIISQYVETEAGTTPKGIEIWNNTAGTFNFATNNLIIQQGTNGGAAVNLTGTLINTGTLAPNSVLVIGTSELEVVTQSNGSQFFLFDFSFNGDDALIVRYGGNTTDVFGTPGSDPGASWSGNGVSTDNQNISLNTGISSGSTGFTNPSLRFHTINSSPSGSGAAGIAGFGVSPITTCTTPSTQASNFSASNLDPTSATLNWARGNGNNVLVVMKQGGAVDTDPNSGTSYTANATFGDGQQIGTGNYVVYNGSGASVNVSGLAAETEYSVAIYEYANSGACYNTTELTGNLTTLCATIYPLPFNENFDTAVPPTCWTQFTGVNGIGTEEQWEIITNSGSTFGGSPGAAFVNFEDVTGGLAEDWLVTPAIDLTGSTNTALSFYAKDGFLEDFGGLYSVKVSTTSQTDRTSFVDVETFTEPQLGNNYNQKIVDLSAYSGNTVYVAFVMTNDDGDAWYLDNVSIYDSTICTPPSQATAFNATAINGGAATATLNWTRGTGDNVLVVMRASGAVNMDPATGTSYNGNPTFGSGDELGTGNYVVYNGPATSVNVSNLMVNTTYYVAIYEYGSLDTCYNTDELIGNFFVSCAIYNSPFEEGFEGANFPPACWASFRGEDGLGVNYDWEHTTDANTGNQAAFADFDFDLSGATEDWLVTPAIDLTGITNTTLTFFSKDGDPEDFDSSYTIRVSTTSQTNYGSFSVVQAYTETQITDSYLQQTVDLSAYDGQTIYIAFVLTQDFGDAWYLDDVKVEGTTSEPDMDTEIYAPLSPIAANTIIAANTTSLGTSEDAFAFIIEDLGTSDGLPTHITTMRFVPGANNTAAWSDVIQGITLVDENATSYFPTTTTINDTEIVLEFSAAVTIFDNTAVEFTLGFYINTAPIVDGSLVQFQIDGASSGFAADASGSGLAEPFTLGTVTGNNSTIDVQATELIFSQQPTDTSVDEVMSPAVIVSAVDINQNLDIDYTEMVQLTSTATFAGSATTSAAAISGIVTFDNLVFSQEGSNETLTTISGLTNDTSALFNIIDNTLNTPNVEIKGLQIYSTSSPRSLYIKGQLASGTSVNLYDLQGRLVKSSKLDAHTNSNEIDVSSLSDGVYVVKLNNAIQQKTQKVIIN